MPETLRIGIVGANRRRDGWAARSHLPAAMASPDVDLVGVCTTRRESAEESAAEYGAEFAFDDYRDMFAHPDIEAIIVVTRVPAHYDITRAAIEAGKPVLTEWPLGVTSDEAETLADLARAKGVPTAVGLQSRVNPPFMYMRDLLADGYVGDILSVRVSMIVGRIHERPSARTWQREVQFGANTLTITNGHTLDTVRYLVGDFSSLSATVGTQVGQWFDTDNKEFLAVTSPDTVLLEGRLATGALASSHVASVPWAAPGLRIEVYGREGTLVAVGEKAQMSGIEVFGAQRSGALQLLEVPATYIHVPDSMPLGDPYCMGQLYYEFARKLRTGEGDVPDFDTAVSLHHLLDVIRQSSESGLRLDVAKS